MTPDRFIAAAFRRIRAKYGNESMADRVLSEIETLSAELARESVGDGNIPPKRLPDDGNGDEDAYNAGFNDCRELWITAWNTRAAGDGNG
jgi:hypothetical protein